MTDIDALVKEIRGNAMWRDNAVAALMNQAADAITSLQYALDKCKPFMGRNAVLEEAAKAMDEQRHLIERQEIEKANRKGQTAGVLYNPEQTLWKLAAIIIRELKSEDEQDGSYAK